MDIKKLHGAITSEDVLGKDVIDSTGKVIGVSDKFYLDPKSLRVLGISVDKGFLRTGYIISSNYIREVHKHAVFLNMEPAILLRGKIVFGLHGAKIGKVTHVELTNDTNTIDAIIVRTGFLGLKKMRIPKEYIKSKDKNIFLTITKKHLHSKKEFHLKNYTKKK